MFRLFIVVTFLFLAVYAFQAVMRLSENRLVRFIYWVLIVSSLTYFIFGIALDISENFRKPNKMIGFANFFAVYIFLGLTSLFLFLEDLQRFVKWSRSRLNRNKKSFASRRKFISRLALGAGVLPFATLIYGIYQGRYNFKVHEHFLKFKDLPDNFDGYKIVHVSDFHCGGLDNYDKVKYAVDLIEKQNADIILFTGDFIDRKSNEIEKWKTLFASLSANDGIFSILGNHDYCDYTDWPSNEAKEKDFGNLKSLQSEMGFQLLLNENKFIERDGQKLCIVGVEYWGANSLRKEGDINMALLGVTDEEFKVLLTHDPTHWEYEIIDHPHHFPLTLAGHTHGLQFGIEIPGQIKWAPLKDRFKYWAGLYKEKEQFLNVNRGFGYTGFPGRVGIWPEVSVITLNRK